MFEEEPEEKLEFLKREEIKTMQKDIARFREIEAQKERERIAALKIAEKKAPERVPPPTPPTPPIPPEKEKVPLDTLIPKPPIRKPSPLTKILVRGAIVLVGLLIFGFLYWFLGVKKPPTEEVIPPVEEEIIPQEEEVVEKPEIIIPPPLILIEEARAPEISKIEEIPEVLSQLMAEELPEGTFTQVVIKNLEENRLASLEDISSAFQTETPEKIFQKLEPDYTLAIYSQEQGKRIVFVGKIREEEGLLEILKNWEKKIKEEGVFLSGEKIPTLVSYFRTSFYKEIGFRYLTISKEDLGICHAWFNDYFVVTTSFESMKRAIDKIRAGEFEKKLGQLFIIGFEGKTITPQTEELFKKYRPGGVLLLSKNIENGEQLKNLISGLQNLSLKETGLPLFVAVDQEGEPMNRIGFLGEKTSQSAIENSEIAYQVGLKRGQELKELGVNLNLAPVLDTASEGDFIFERIFQKSPEEIGELAKSLISGQKGAGILTAIKHFPGYSGISFNPEEELAILETIPEISQFKKAMEVKPELVMTSNVIYNEIDSTLPFIFSPPAIQFLENNLGSEILIISDDLAQNSLLKKFTLKEIVTKPIQAGVDILIFSGWRESVEEGLKTYFEAYRNGEISEAKINQAVSRIIQLKEKLIK